MGHIDQFKRHICGSFHGVFVSTSGAKAAVTAEWNKFHLSTVGTAIHSTTVRRITTMDHLIDIFNNSIARMKNIEHFLIMV